MIYQGYSVALARYYLHNFIMKYFPQSPIFSWDFVDGLYVANEQTFLEEFLQRYLIQLNNQPNNPIDYKLDFDQYSIQTNTKESTLMDFAQNIKRHISDKDISFLLENYDNFRNLTIEYESSFSLKELTKDILSTI